MIALKNHDERSIKRFASNHVSGYRSAVAANSAAGFGDPSKSRRNSAQITIAGAFFVPAVPCYGSCARETEMSAGFLDSRFANLRTAATHNRLATVRGSSSNQGATPMHYILTLSPPKARAAAHRAMAMAALRSKSSLSVRLKRYNAHMATARRLDGGAA